jgi:hypothetical protein
MRRFVSLVNWHLTLLLEHSEQLAVSVASHLTFLSRQASQLGSFLLWRYARFCVWPPDVAGNWEWVGRGVPATDSLDGSESRSMMDEVAVTGVYGWNELVGSWWTAGSGDGMPMGCGGGAGADLGALALCFIRLPI